MRITVEQCKTSAAQVQDQAILTSLLGHLLCYPHEVGCQTAQKVVWLSPAHLAPCIMPAPELIMRSRFGTVLSSMSDWFLGTFSSKSSSGSSCEGSNGPGASGTASCSSTSSSRRLKPSSVAPLIMSASICAVHEHTAQHSMSYMPCRLQATFVAIFSLQCTAQDTY